MTTGKKIVYVFLAATVPMLLYAFSSGPDPRYTAAPGDNPMACANAGCHSGLAKGGPINAAGGAVTATFSSGSTYTPGQDVTITVNVTDPQNTLHGFQMSARLGNNDADLATKQAGRFSYLSSAGVFVLCDNNVPRSPTGDCPATFPVEFIEHNAPRAGAWTFTWTPPATSQGPVHFYVAGNAVNGDRRNGPEDHVYTASFVLQPAAPSCGQSLPVIDQVVSAKGFGGLKTFTSGSYLEITGANLAGTTSEWLAGDFDGNNAPTTVQGTSVSINGKAGFVSYVSPTQVNVQAPADTSVGPVGITVTNCSGTSAPATFTRSVLAPGMLAPGTDLSQFFNIGGKQFLVATFGAQARYVGDTSMVPGLSQPAKPGDSIWLYGIGFGDVQGGAPGVIAPGGTTLNTPVTISFGQTPAVITYKGFYPSFVGLDLFIVTVPDVPDGDYQINVTENGQRLQQPAAFLTVHK